MTLHSSLASVSKLHKKTQVSVHTFYSINSDSRNEIFAWRISNISVGKTEVKRCFHVTATPFSSTTTSAFQFVTIDVGFKRKWTQTFVTSSISFFFLKCPHSLCIHF